MGLSLIAFLLFLLCPIYSSASTLPNRVLFLIQSGHLSKAFSIYNDFVKQNGSHDYELLQQVGLHLIEQGFKSSDPEEKIMAAFGAGMAFHEKSLYLLEEGLKSSIPQLQLICLNFLAKYQNDESDEALNLALSSKYLLIRLEGAYHLAKRKSTTAVAQAESLMNKIDKELLPLFPQIFAAAGTNDAISILRKMLAQGSDLVRLAAIICVAENGRDDLLPSIRMLSSHYMPAQQEACAFALGVLKDDSSIQYLSRMLNSKSPFVQLASYQALYQLGKSDIKAKVEEMAKNENLFAIALLKDFEGSEELLAELCQHSNFQVRANAAISLLIRHDPRCLPIIAELLLKDSRDLAIIPQYSSGKTLSCFKVVPSARQNFDSDPQYAELALQLREQIVTEILQLPENYFLQFANILLESKQNDLIPIVIDGLAELSSEKSIAILKKHQQKAGAPLIRNYCNLALYKLQEPGPYGEQLKLWVSSHHQSELIQFRPMLGKDLKSSSYEISLKETSRLLVDAFSAFTESQDQTGIDALLNAIQNGNPKNKFALAGLLINALH